MVRLLHFSSPAHSRHNFIFNYASLLHKIYTILCSTKYKLHKFPPQTTKDLRGKNVTQYSSKQFHSIKISKKFAIYYELMFNHVKVRDIAKKRYDTYIYNFLALFLRKNHL